VLRSSISVMEERVLDSEAADRQSLKESERFRKSAQSVVELQRFFRVPFVAHELLAELAGLKPQDLIFTKVSFSDSVDKPKGKGAHMSYAIRIVGDVQELPVLAQFKEAVEASSFFNPEGFALDVDESIQRRDAQTGVTPFRVSISLSPETTPKKGGKK